MGRGARAGIGIVAVAGAALLGRDAVAQVVTFETPHAVRAPSASLEPAMAKALDALATQAKLATVDELIGFSLRATGKALHFGLAHKTDLAFDGKEREGNCVEYAELFATVFNRERGSIDARAWVVRSDARFLGQTMSQPALKDHDWVLLVVRTPTGAKRLYVDATLDDIGLGWDISRAVHGEVRAP
jgi:hypothetical protein